MLQQPRRQHQHRAQCTRAVEAARTPRGRDRDFCNRWVVPVSSAPARPVCAMGALLKGPARPPFLPCLPVLASAMENRNRAGRLPRPDPGIISPLSSSLAGTEDTRLPVRCDPRMSSPARCVAGGDGPRSRQGALLDAPACQQRTRPPTNTRLRNTKNRLAHKSRAGQGPRTTRHISPSPFPPPYPRRGVYCIPAVSIERVRACMNVIEQSRACSKDTSPLSMLFLPVVLSCCCLPPRHSPGIPLPARATPRALAPISPPTISISFDHAAAAAMAWMAVITDGDACAPAALLRCVLP